MSEQTDTPYKQADARSVPTGYLEPTAEWIGMPPDDAGHGNESIMALIGLLSKCEQPGMDPRMRAIAGKAFRDAGISGIMIQMVPGDSDAQYILHTHVMRAGDAASAPEVAPCAGA